MSLRFYWMYVTFTHDTQILGIELDLVLLFWFYSNKLEHLLMDVPCQYCCLLWIYSRHSKATVFISFLVFWFCMVVGFFISFKNFLIKFSSFLFWMKVFWRYSESFISSCLIVEATISRSNWRTSLPTTFRII